ncbi:MAG: YggS family pyridoxal phosphate-dependent enzyme [Desulfatiglandaceae bacterium]|jgi:PLP dependent protein
MIREMVKRTLEELPPGVQLVGAAKTRTVEEILEAVEAGMEIVGENYVQEAEKAFKVIGHRVKWHLIGHLQRNKVRKAVPIFDMIETVDSVKLAREIDRVCKKMEKVMPILIEINSGEEEQKTGVFPSRAASVIREIATLERVRVQGLMTMGPFAGDPEEARPYFRVTRELFETVRAMKIPGVDLRYLSMGMSNSYRIALEEGANLVRIGTNIFGERHDG